MTDVQANPLAPLGADCSQLPTFTLVTYRDQLNFMPSDHAQHIPDVCDTRLNLHRIQLRRNDHTYWETQHSSHVEAWYQWRLSVRDGPALAVEILSYPNDEYIRWYRGITRVYIRNPTNCDTRSVGYQLAGVDRRMMEVDDMASVVIQEQPSSPSQTAVFAKKVQTIIRRCMVFIGGTLGCTPSQHNIQQTFPVQPSHRRPREHVLDWGACGVKRGARKQLGCGAGGRRPPIPHFQGRQGYVEVERGEGSGVVDPFDCLNLDIPSFSFGLTPPSQSLLGGSGTLQMPLPPGLGLAPFHSPHPTSFGFFGFRAPLPPGTAGSSTPHHPISQASSSNEEEWTNDTNVVQHLGFRHRVGKKTTRFTPSDWP
ncbi:hypothetical protein M9H77_29477 [Catharanthus roseus]|uniref:Uncharacterized protein n=1 Tax=Catharanthus roseus TaxID=4058 RepID=A0ACB9ZVJ6_CATRO|nr:hypothetical protein M9H77_29477 [Catharanthus roseus]